MPLHRSFRFALALVGAVAFTVPGQVRADMAGPYLAARSADMAGDFTEARRYLARALTADPSNEGLLEALVLANVGVGDFAGAVPVARRLVSMGSKTQIAALVMLVDRMAGSDYEAMLADLDGSKEVAGPVVEQLVRGWALIGAGRMAPALEIFDQMSKRQGFEAFGLYHKALALAVVGDFEGADLLMSDQQNPLMATRRAIHAHAVVLSQLDRSADALARLDQLFGDSADPELDALRAGLKSGKPIPFDTVRNARDGMAETFHMLAVILQGEASELQVLLQSRMAEWLRPDHLEAVLLSAAALEQMGQENLAIAAYAKVPGNSPLNLAALTGKIQALYRLDRKAEALTEAQRLATEEGQYVSVHVALGDLLRREERYAEAAEAYGKALGLLGKPDERHWALYYSRAIAWEQAKQWDKAEPDFRRALELRPDQPQVLNYLGYSLLDRNMKIDEALAMIERAVAQRPEDGHIIDSLAWGYFLTGKYDRAVVQMERASLLLPVDPVVTDHLGDVYWAVGRVNEARFQWRRALSFEPTERDANLIRRKLEVGLDAVLAEEGLPALDARGKK